MAANSAAVSLLLPPGNGSYGLIDATGFPLDPANLPKGSFEVSGLMELLGHIDGKIFADAIVIEEGGSALGELHAESVGIKGRFEGEIHGRHVTLHSRAQVSGAIHYETLTIESGAEVSASCARRTGADAAKAPAES